MVNKKEKEGRGGPGKGNPKSKKRKQKAKEKGAGDENLNDGTEQATTEVDATVAKEGSVTDSTHSKRSPTTVRTTILTSPDDKRSTKSLAKRSTRLRSRKSKRDVDSVASQQSAAKIEEPKKSVKKCIPVKPPVQEEEKVEEPERPPTFYEQLLSQLPAKPAFGDRIGEEDILKSAAKVDSELSCTTLIKIFPKDEWVIIPSIKYALMRAQKEDCLKRWKRAQERQRREAELAGEVECEVSEGELEKNQEVKTLWKSGEAGGEEDCTEIIYLSSDECWGEQSEYDELVGECEWPISEEEVEGEDEEEECDYQNVQKEDEEDESLGQLKRQIRKKGGELPPIRDTCSFHLSPSAFAEESGEAPSPHPKVKGVCSAQSFDFTEAITQFATLREAALQRQRAEAEEEARKREEQLSPEDCLDGTNQSEYCKQVRLAMKPPEPLRWFHYIVLTAHKRRPSFFLTPREEYEMRKRESRGDQSPAHSAELMKHEQLGEYNSSEQQGEHAEAE